MPRLKHIPLRGSVTQNTTTVRMRPRNMSPAGFMLRLSTLIGSVLLILGFIAWLWHIGWPQRQCERLASTSLLITQKLDFAVRDVVVIGRQQTPKDVLTHTLGIEKGAPILGFDPEAAQQRLIKLPWVASVTVERHLPNTIVVQLTERIPLARWQHNGHTVVIDTNGKELVDAKTDQFSQLPLVVGAGADEHADSLLSILKSFPIILDKITAATFVSERRWDIYLQPKVVAKLPEGDIKDALSRLTQLITEQKILERNVVTIDLRLADRLVIEPSHPVSTHPSGDMRL